ncbi:MAG: hypothetical protein ACLGHP_06020, partial [Vicinamibacteria bacterium]
MRPFLFTTLTALIATSSAAGQPPLTLPDAVREALTANTTLAAERAGIAPLRERPAQARALPPPMAEAQIWRWPVTTLNPGRVDMFMFMGQQALPARGARDADHTLALRDVEYAE